MADFIAIDFLVRPHPKKLTVSDNVEARPGDFHWEPIVERVVKRIGRILTQKIEHSEKRTRCALEGLNDEQQREYLGTFVLECPSRKEVKVLQQEIERHLDGDAIDSMTLQAKEGGVYLNLLAHEFLLSGPKGKEWPLNHWAAGAAELQLFVQAASWG